MNAVVTAAAIRGVRPFDGIDCDPPTLEENAEACGDAMSARIRELEANPPKPHHNGLMQISNELASAKQRIAELESRTVTVKLPDIMPPEAAPAHYWGEGESMAYVDGYNKSAADLKTSFAQACSFAGVNVEFE